MAKPYTVTITNGTGTANVVNDQYNVTANVVGYDNSTITPSNVTIVDGTLTYNFTIAATGTLTLHVSENGTTTSTPIVNASFTRTNQDGTENYGTFTTNQEGIAIINNIPFDASTPPTIYYKQTASDGNHNFDDSVKQVSMNESTKTVEIENPLPPTQTFNLTDINYPGVNIESGTITLN